ncbi:hypothetical protein SISSUDRAFT_1046320 [Sistotremastrum suecicum HHB10207 ss-3]|uniref:Uncharacterized protein n=1 Tax=Sistotremastrum suecicum HHB10207 ss-3 TaxID=1314776 RepID=A0A166DT94_9AGAM|nr:hypothetical protein SISSUDRAFT_1046320 [Sistotremastrum suecicum HHB10207 ss-3]
MKLDSFTRDWESLMSARSGRFGRSGVYLSSLAPTAAGKCYCTKRLGDGRRRVAGGEHLRNPPPVTLTCIAGLPINPRRWSAYAYLEMKLDSFTRDWESLMSVRSGGFGSSGVYLSSLAPTATGKCHCTKRLGDGRRRVAGGNHLGGPSFHRLDLCEAMDLLPTGFFSTFQSFIFERNM